MHFHFLISNHFTELVLEITEMERLKCFLSALTRMSASSRIDSRIHGRKEDTHR